MRIKLIESGVDRLARGHHKPDALVVAQPVSQIGHGVCRGCPRLGGRLDGRFVEVESDHVVALFESSVDNDPPHPSEADNAQLHTRVETTR